VTPFIFLDRANRLALILVAHRIGYAMSNGAGSTQSASTCRAQIALTRRSRR
jgi:hypothetical protein